MRKPLNPFTKDPGYTWACWDPFTGWFVVYDTYAMKTDVLFRERRWCAESKKVGERIYTKTLEKAKSAALEGTRGGEFTSWDYVFSRAQVSADVATPDLRGKGNF